MSFKVGQKVVFVHDKRFMNDWIMTYPKDHEICTISGFSNNPIGELHVGLVGYETAPDGASQWYYYKLLRPLDYSFVEEVIKQVTSKEVEV